MSATVPMPASVMSTEPDRWIAAAPAAHMRRPCCKSVTTSEEKVENVVRPPQKPVTTKSRHSGDRAEKEPKTATATPMMYPPIRFAARVPGGMAGNRLLRLNPNTHRSSAPKAAPTEIARTDFHMHLSLA